MKGKAAKRLERAAQVAALRPGYLTDLAAGVERFFEARRNTCPWCDGDRLATRLRTTDLLQHKPGTFVLDRCEDCGHVFQNPKLNDTGLEFYYRDFYDGLGEDMLNHLFSAKEQPYQSRARALKPHTEPRSWLDIGTGHGHFPKAAKNLFPHTRFDGLDLGEGVEAAQARGWIAHSYRGQFTELAADLAERYDVVSMFHYLEHTPHPRRELAAARTVLRPGGHVVIEVPDSESRWSRILGTRWIPWLQLRHLHFVPIGNPRTALSEHGFTSVAEQRDEARHRSDDRLPRARADQGRARRDRVHRGRERVPGTDAVRPRLGRHGPAPRR